MRLESYAQELEDVILWSVLKDVEKGFYIDVGANDPTHISVTKFFYDKGWNGINIEPLRSKCILLEEKRPRDINLCVGVGVENGKMPLVAAGVSSTFDMDVAVKGGMEVERSYNKIVLTLTEIWKRFCSTNQQIHFCKIDVEGYERQVLEGIQNWEEFRPWIFVVEAAEPGTVIASHKKWEKILIENDYICAFSTPIERYYVDMRKEHLIDRFAKVKDFMNQNEVVVFRMENVDVNTVL